MAGIKTYTTSANSGRMHVILKRYVSFVLWMVVLFVPARAFAQNEPEFDEISVFLDVPRVGGTEMDAVIKGDKVYLPVTDLFDFLKIRNIPSPGMDTISGFFITPEAVYSINRLTNRIRFGEKIFDLEPDALIKTETNLYLNSNYYGKIFGLDCIFDFRNLSVSINTRLELPVIREMRQEEMRRNISRLKGEIRVDTAIGRQYPVFHFGMADWSVIATEQVNGPAETRLNLSLGAIIAGGETTVSLNYNSRDPFTEKQQYYLWRYVNNDNRAIRQVMAGKIATHATSSIYNPVVGAQITNTPTTFRRSFGSYTLSDKTEPGWIVELYVNNILVDYVKSDASGFFTFEVPLVYGNSMVRLKFYGPWGEERTREQNITIPYNFIPVNTLEYTVSAGMVEDTLLSRFSRTSINYGLTRGVTVGAGFEYLSSVNSSPFMPYASASFRLASNLLLSGEYTHKVRAKGSMTYRLPSNLQIDLFYTIYNKDQKAINYNYLEERKAVVSMPVRIKKFMAYNRLTVNQLVLPTTRYSTAEYLISASLFGVNTNITTFALFIGRATPYVYSNLSLSLRFPGGFTIIPQTQYGYTDKKLLSVKIGLEKRVIQRGFLNLSYEQNFMNNLRMGELGFRYDFKFAQTGFSARQTDKITTLTQYARGSLIADGRTNFLGTDNRTNVGRGGITVIPYLDLNANGKRDTGEPKAYGLNLRSGGGRIERNEKDTTIRILSLEPYTDCYIELDQSSFENIAWRLKNRTLSVAVDPNMLKLVEIPVLVMGEASGMVQIDKGGVSTGLARIIVNFYNKDQKQVGRTLTEEDGYFSYFGLAPGSYNVRPDSVQLRRLGMKCSPDSINFNISVNRDGDFIDGLDFIIKMKSPVQTIAPEQNILLRDSSIIALPEITPEIVKRDEAGYIIQIGAFLRKGNAEAFRKRAAKVLSNNVQMIAENGFYKVRIADRMSKKEVDDYINVLRRNGFTFMIIPAGTREVRKVAAPGYAIQMGAFRRKANADDFIKKLSAVPDITVVVLVEDGYYKVRITGFGSTQEAENYKPELKRYGFTEMWVTHH
jgi:cell division protein FtsN